MEYPVLSHHGGTRGVTGSCHQLHLDPSTSLLVDCGLEQGAEAAPGAETASLGFDVQGIELWSSLMCTSITLAVFRRYWLPATAALSFVASLPRGCCHSCWKMPTN